jgi:hypothetical protein
LSTVHQFGAELKFCRMKRPISDPILKEEDEKKNDEEEKQ